MLVSNYKVENIHIITEKLNKYIDEQRADLKAIHRNPNNRGEQASFYTNKTEVECMDRWLQIRNNTEDGTVKQIKGNWTPEEDMILKKKVAQYGLKKWKEIAIQTKTACLDLNAAKITATKIREIGTAQMTVATSLKVNEIFFTKGGDKLLILK